MVCTVADPPSYRGTHSTHDANLEVKREVSRQTSYVIIGGSRLKRQTQRPYSTSHCRHATQGKSPCYTFTQTMGHVPSLE
ncbi:hypothetical protein BaRGS_00029220 [Batillaria attramentaria]|uniref:Uncharacterized protein n=1 Tax=Batillaria attramentaria TaxID=370345 RepID=A0ABD0JYC2_9CAEN